MFARALKLVHDQEKNFENWEIQIHWLSHFHLIDEFMLIPNDLCLFQFTGEAM